MLHAKQLRFSYQAETHKSSPTEFGLNIEELLVRRSEVHALIGPNGCGKSTLLRLMSGILPPLEGEILLENQNIQNLPRSQLALRLAFLPQQIAPVFPLNVHEVILMGRHPHRHGLGLANPEDLGIVQCVMQRMGVEHLRDRHFNTLSGGERQKVLIASILAQEPRVILLDEPTSFLDIHHQAEVFQLLKSESKLGVAILVVTHDLGMAGHFADRITLMKSGKLIKSGSPGEVLVESVLCPVYGEQIRVIPDPQSGAPCVLPRGEHSHEISPKPVEDKTTQAPPLHPHLTSFSLAFTLSLFFVVMLFSLCISPMIGSEKVQLWNSLQQMLSENRDAWNISTQILAIRLPRVFTGLLAGMALGCVGAAFQSLLRNPLAEPYTLGIASAATLGAIIPLSYPTLTFVLGPISGVQLWAFVFAMLGVACLRVLSQKQQLVSGITGLLLTGVTLSLINGALVMLVRFLANPLALHTMDQWMVGGVEVAGWSDLGPTLPLLIPGLLILTLNARKLNQIALGEEMAMGRGIAVEQVQRAIFLGGSLTTASIVSVTGPIGFVGLIVPHIVRKCVGSDQRLVLPCSLMAGGTLLVLADSLARCLSLGGRGAELPVGILTSLVGGPLFLILLLGLHRKSN